MILPPHFQGKRVLAFVTGRHMGLAVLFFVLKMS